jgi:hypothetical protein
MQDVLVLLAVEKKEKEIRSVVQKKKPAQDKEKSVYIKTQPPSLAPFARVANDARAAS